MDCEEINKIEEGIFLDKLQETIMDRLHSKIIEAEFRILRRITETQYHTEDLYENQIEDHKLNRYPDILPCIFIVAFIDKQTIVKLLREPGSSKSTYINASFINVF